MYLDNVRKKLATLDDKQKDEIARKTREILLEKKLISKNVRNGSVLKSLNNFINLKDTSVNYLGGFLQALDEIYPEGGKRALLGDKLDGRNTWRNLLIRVTNDLPSPQLEKYLDEPHIIKEFKHLYVSLTKKCVTEDKDETVHMLQILNRIFSK